MFFCFNEQCVERIIWWTNWNRHNLSPSNCVGVLSDVLVTQIVLFIDQKQPDIENKGQRQSRSSLKCWWFIRNVLLLCSDFCSHKFQIMPTVLKINQLRTTISAEKIECTRSKKKVTLQATLPRIWIYRAWVEVSLRHRAFPTDTLQNITGEFNVQRNLLMTSFALWKKMENV